MNELEKIFHKDVYGLELEKEIDKFWQNVGKNGLNPATSNLCVFDYFNPIQCIELYAAAANDNKNYNEQNYDKEKKQILTRHETKNRISEFIWPVLTLATSYMGYFNNLLNDTVGNQIRTDGSFFAKINYLGKDSIQQAVSYFNDRDQYVNSCTAAERGGQLFSCGLITKEEYELARLPENEQDAISQYCKEIQPKNPVIEQDYER